MTMHRFFFGTTGALPARQTAPAGQPFRAIGGAAALALAGLWAAPGTVLAQAAPAPAATTPPASATAPAAVRPSARTAASRNNRSGDFILAVVNSELVTSVEVAQRVERAVAEIRRAGGTPPPDDELRKQALEALIDERVQITHARDAGGKVDEADIDRAVAGVANQNQLTVPQLRERLKEDGMDYQRFRSTLRDQMLVERVREREVLGRVRVSDDEVEQLVAQQQAQQAGEPQLNLAQVLVTVPEGASAEVVAQRQARAEAALARARAGEDFAKVARELSEDSNREAGGEIGLRPASRLPDVFVAAVQGLGSGTLRPQLLRSGAGFHVLKVLERQAQGTPMVTETRARHILLRVADPAQGPAVLRRMEELRRRIERGEQKFDDAAKALSEDGSAAGGGDLGWAAPGQFVPEFEEAMAKLAPGGISPPVVSRFGVHLIQVQERRQTAVDPKVLREQARAQLREQKFEPAVVDWVKELRLRAYVELREPPL